jgi:hypothetical protein
LAVKKGSITPFLTARFSNEIGFCLDPRVGLGQRDDHDRIIRYPLASFFLPERRFFKLLFIRDVHFLFEKRRKNE